MICGAIFDIDGVLLDSMTIWRDLGSRYLKRHNIQPKDGLDKILFSMSMEQGAEYLKNEYCNNADAADILDEIKDMLKEFYYYEVEPKDNAAGLLKFLKDREIRIAAATSSPREHVEKALARTKLLPFIERIFTTSEIGESKHSPLIYNTAAAYLGTTPDKTFVFEDSLYALKTAADSGYCAVGVYDRYGESDKDGVRTYGRAYLKNFDDFDIILPYMTN